ncbi:effector-associated constant component EACC1 [Nocardia xishanensis]
MAEVRIAVDGLGDGARSLWEWLRYVPELRGWLRADEAVAPDEAMGVPIELVVALTAGAPAVAMALARSLSTWLVQRRADVTVTLTGPDGLQISLSGQRVADPEKLVQAVLDSITPTLPESVPPTTDSTVER